MHTALLLILAGCSSAPSPMATPQAAVRAALGLTITGSGVRRTELEVTVTGAIPGSTIRLTATDADAGDAPHAPCDSADTGCSGLEPGTGPFGGRWQLPNGTANSSGTAIWRVYIAQPVPVGDYTLQAQELGSFARSAFVPATVSRRPTEYMLLTLGYTDSCGLTPQGAAVCWPDSNDGETHGPPRHWKDFDLGIFFGCGIDEADDLHCWGQNDLDLRTPNITAVQVSAGNQEACVLDGAGDATCWGYNPSYWEHPHAGSYVDVTSAYRMSCGLRADGQLDCWGTSDALQHVPTGPFDQVDANDSGMCARRVDRSHVCWDRLGAEEIPGRYRQWSAGTLAFCGVRRSNEELACFARQSTLDVVRDMPSGRFKDVRVGYTHACATHLDGTVECWGHSAGGDPTPPFLAASMQHTGDTGN